MCNLYSLGKKRHMVARFFRVPHNRAVLFEPTLAIFSGYSAPVVRATDDRALVRAEGGRGAAPDAFPGIWRRYRGPVKKNGEAVDIEVYSFLTTTPNPPVETINHERMRVLLAHEHEFETCCMAPMTRP